MSCAANAILSTDLPGFELVRRGKVRDVYRASEGKLLIVATDRISAFDCILPNAIPDKGIVLTQISAFWFRKFSNLVRNHVISANLNDFPEDLKAALPASLNGRTTLGLEADVVPFECVVRGYIAGSGWKDYLATGEVCGHRLPPDLLESARLPEPLFTPATKSEEGHDINVSIQAMSDAVGTELTTKLKDISLEIYSRASEYALSRGIIICDTKFEFGIRDGEIVWIDEALTPDSSRFWPQDAYQPGGPQPSFDKQFVRDYLETLDWNKQAPAPTLPDDVVSATRNKYLDAYRKLTGETLTI